MTSNSHVYPEKVDITNCEKEPIHIIGKVQSHGVLITCEAKTLTISQTSNNTSENFQIKPDDLLQKPLSRLIGTGGETELRERLESKKLLLPEELVLNGRSFIMLPHVSDGHLLLDFEPLEKTNDSVSFQQQLTHILNNLRSAESVEALCGEAAVLTREIFGYDRVMIYRFDDAWNGEVIAEQKEQRAESWLGLHYPASDIPSQSRNLFLKHRVRIISDVNDIPIPLVPQLSPVDQKPLDLSRSSLRAVSPIHIEYLQNMGVGASLTAAIVINGKLWGLIACHHNTAKFLNYYQRESCRFLAQMFSNELALRETNSFLEKTESSGRQREKLVEQMQRTGELPNALTEQEVKITDLISCGGGAVFLNGELSLTGNTPSKEEVLYLIANFLSQKNEALFYCKDLSQRFPEAAGYKETASGVLSYRIAENNYVIWFRPEVVQTVSWGGNPAKKVTYNEEKQRLGPRKSFEKWTEELRGIAESFKDFDLSIAKSLGDNISYFIQVKQSNEIESLNRQLMEANKELELFSYGLSHDLRAPLRGINGYLNIIKEDYEVSFGEDGAKLLDTTLGLTEKMDRLIEGILSYFKHSTGELNVKEFCTNDLVEEVLAFLDARAAYPSTRIAVQEGMPPMYGDRRMLFQVWANLINNAFIYSSRQEDPEVQIGAISREEKIIYFVKDNGIGIAPEYKEKIFATFSRLAGDKFKGSGIGLSLVKRVLQKHDGEVWVESEPGRGAAFYFSL